MTWLRRTSRALILLALFGMIAVSAVGFFALRGDVAMLQRLSLERIEWKTAQLETETARLTALIGRHIAGEPAVDPREITAGLERLAASVESYLNGSAGVRIESYDADGVLGTLRELIARHRVRPGEARRMLRDFTGLGEPLRDLSRSVVWGEEIRFHAIRAGLRRNAEITLTLSLAGMVLAAALVGALMVEVQRHRRASRENLELANHATAANRAKSRFMTMMSHELRTPMNGVLGLVALARQSGLSEAQERLLDHADRSGRQMIAQLTDILDFAELDSGALTLERAPFALGDLAAGLRELFGPVARRDGVAFSVTCGGDADLRVVSDIARLRQIARHLMSFLLERVAVREIAVTLGHSDSRLCITLEADEPPEGAPGWRFEAALGDAPESWGAIESDAFGPTIARALIARFGGTLTLERPGAGRAQLIVSVPAEALGRAGPAVRVEVDSATMRTVCCSMLARLGLDRWEIADAGRPVDAIVVEAGAEGVAARLGELRRTHPGARIVALGPAAPGLACDAVLPYPPDLAAFRDAIGPPPVPGLRASAE